MRKSPLRILPALIAFALGPFLACDDASGTACTPGQSVACTGPGACAGFQVCRADGSGFDACVCDGASSSSSSSSSAASSSSGITTSTSSGGGTGGVGGTGTTSSAASGMGGVGGMGTTSSTDVASSSAVSSSVASSSSGSPVCMNVFMGSFTIQNSLDIATITPYCEITGDLTASGSGLTQITLPNLQKIGGKFTATSTPDLQTLQLPALETSGRRSPRAACPTC